MELKEIPVCQKTTEKPEPICAAWVCKESDQEMRLEDDQWVCDQCTGGGTKAGTQQQVHKPRPPTENEIQIKDGIRKAREAFEKQKRKEELERERENQPRPRGG